MSSVPRCAAVCLWLASISFGQQTGPTAQELSLLESFANQPNSRVIWSKEMGLVNSADAQALISAVVLTGPSPNREMQGVRIDFLRSASKDRIYVERRFVKQLADALVQIDEMAPSFLARRVGQASCFGSGVFLRAVREGANFFHASSCEMSDGFTGLRIDTGTQTFRFATADLKLFIVMLERAAADLDKR